MASDEERRKKFWEDDEEGGDASSGVSGGGSDRIVGSFDVDRRIAEARTLMDQTHQLYLQYFGGIEKRPPIEKARLLDSRIAELQRVSTNLTAAKFKISQFIAQYHTMKELWERKLRDLERK